jgi:lipopolysaccharide/colanic/teichoic acid biosynthesis glycosyltransferase
VHYPLYSDEQKRAIDTLTPGLSGIGSLVFRDEERLLRGPGVDPDYLHDCLVAPYKGDLERWYASNHSVSNYFKILILTTFSFFSPTGDYLRFFRGVPEPDPRLRSLMRDRSE